MAIHLPREFAIAGNVRIEERDAAPVNRRRALSGARFQGPIRSWADRDAAITKVDLTSRDPFRGGDHCRRGFRTASPKLARRELRIGESREDVTDAVSTAAKTSQQRIAVRELVGLPAVEQLTKLSIGGAATVGGQSESLETSPRGLRASYAQLVDRRFSQLAYALDESRHHRRW
jgi:hypothetical protein